MFSWCPVGDIMGFPRWKHFFNFMALFCLMNLCSFAPVFSQTLNFYCGFDMYEPNSLYEQNRQNILDGIGSNIGDNGYYSVSNGTDADAVHVEALCRADTQLEDCQTCISQVAEDILQICNYSMNAYVWRRWCILRVYNNTMSWNEYDIWNYPICLRTVASYDHPEIPDSQLVNLDTLLNNLSANASSTHDGSSDSLMVAAGNFSGDPVIYSMVQCMPDLSPNDCDRCLYALQIRPSCVDSSYGTVILTPRCFLQYETYPFYNSTRLQQVEDMLNNDAASPPAPATSTETAPPPGRSTPRNPDSPAPPLPLSSSPPCKWINCFSWKISITIAAALCVFGDLFW